MSSSTPDICSHCGAPLAPGVRFCTNCGAAVAPLAPLPPPPPRAPAVNRPYTPATQDNPLGLSGDAASGKYWIVITTSGRGDLLLFIRSTVWPWLIAGVALAILFFATIVVVVLAAQSGSQRSSSGVSPITAIAPPGTPTRTSVPTRTPTPQATAVAVLPTAVLTRPRPPTNTPVPSATRVPPTAVPSATVPCTNNAALAANVTILDNTIIKAGQSFVKTWRIKNTGSCAWDNTYTFEFTGGDQMSGASPQSVTLTKPNATIDISVSMIAPDTPGTYTGQWGMRAPNSAFFGGTVRVVIIVAASATATPTQTATFTPTPACAGSPDIPSFTASPATITTGGTSTLRWGQITNATSVSLQPNIGNVGMSGSKTVQPASTTTYTLIAVCSVSGQTSSLTVTVNVNPAPTAATVHSSGTPSIPENSYFDLDEGAAGNADADIFYQKQSATQRFIAPQNGTLLAKMSTTAPGKSGCLAASLAGSRLNVNSLPTGTYVCYLTSQGRYGQFRVNSVPASPGAIVINFTTWD